MGRLLCALGLVALMAGCQRRPTPEQWADAYDRGFWLGYQAAVDSVKAAEAPNDMFRYLDAMDLQYDVLVKSDAPGHKTLVVIHRNWHGPR